MVDQNSTFSYSQNRPSCFHVSPHHPNTFPKTNSKFAPENRPKRPKRKRESLPTTIFQVFQLAGFVSGSLSGWSGDQSAVPQLRMLPGVNGTGCSAYPACVAVGMTGQCCPNSAKVPIFFGRESMVI